MAKLIADGFVTAKEIVPYDKISKIERVDNIFTVHYTNNKNKKSATDMVVKREKIQKTEEYLTVALSDVVCETRDQDLLEASGVWLWIFLATSVICVLALNLGLSSTIGKTNINIALITSGIICLIASLYSFSKKKQVFILRNPNYQV